MTVDRMGEKFQQLTYLYLTQMKSLTDHFNSGHYNRNEYERLSDFHDNIYRMNVKRIFDRLSWEDQIKLCVEAQDPILVSRLDEEQLATYWIVK